MILVQAAKLIGAGIAVSVISGAGVGIGTVFGALISRRSLATGTQFVWVNRTMGTDRCPLQRPGYQEGLSFAEQDCARLAHSTCPYTQLLFSCHLNLFYGRCSPEEEDKLLARMFLMNIMVPGGAGYSPS